MAMATAVTVGAMGLGGRHGPRSPFGVFELDFHFDLFRAAFFFDAFVFFFEFDFDFFRFFDFFFGHGRRARRRGRLRRGGGGEDEGERYEERRKREAKGKAESRRASGDDRDHPLGIDSWRGHLSFY